MRATMRAIVLHGPSDARLEELPIPVPGPGELHLRIRAALTCGTDLKVFRRGYHARMIRPPAVFGHEMAGIIDALGPGTSGWEVGETVVPANSAPCGACFYCRRDREELCEDLLFLNGAYAEYVIVPARVVARNLHRVPAGLDPAAAALAEPLACAIHALDETGCATGDTVAVLGAGPLGLLLAREAVLRGCRALVAGRRPERLCAARAIGAAATFDIDACDPARSTADATGGRGADAVIEAVGRPEAWEQAVALVRAGGTVNFFGGCPSGTTVTLDTGRVHYEALRLIGSFHHPPRTFRAALDRLATGEIPVHALIAARMDLAALAAALPNLASGGGPLKVEVTP